MMAHRHTDDGTPKYTQSGAYRSPVAFATMHALTLPHPAAYGHARVVSGRVQMREVEAEDLRIDIRSPDSSIHWLNDIETGRQYWHWSQSVNSLLQPMFPGQMHRIQRNLYNVVALIDPADPEGLLCAAAPFTSLKPLNSHRKP